MAEFTAEVWVVIGGVMFAGGLAILHSFATVIRNQCHVHDLKVRVNSLRLEYQAVAQARREAVEVGDVDPGELGAVDIVSSPSKPSRRAA